MMNAVRMKLPLGLWLALGAAGCASHTAAPAGVPVRPLISERVTLRGTASPTLESASCTAGSPAKPGNVLELSEGTRATIELKPPPGEAALPMTMLHLTHLDSNRTWCAMTQADGTPAIIAGEFPSGQYTVSVAEVKGAAPRAYEVRVVKL